MALDLSSGKESQLTGRDVLIVVVVFLTAAIMAYLLAEPALIVLAVAIPIAIAWIGIDKLAEPKVNTGFLWKLLAVGAIYFIVLLNSGNWLVGGFLFVMAFVTLWVVCLIPAIILLKEILSLDKTIPSFGQRVSEYLAEFLGKKQEKYVTPRNINIAWVVLLSAAIGWKINEFFPKLAGVLFMIIMGIKFVQSIDREDGRSPVPYAVFLGLEALVFIAIQAVPGLAMMGTVLSWFFLATVAAAPLWGWSRKGPKSSRNFIRSFLKRAYEV